MARTSCTTVTVVEAGVLVVGGGGHALVSIEVLRAAGYDVAGCVTRDGTSSAALDVLGVEVLGTDADLSTLARRFPCAFVAIGDNHDRQRCTEAVLVAGGTLARAVSTSATVSATASLGAGVLVMPGAVVNAFASLERGAIVNTKASVDHGCRVGAFAHVAPGVSLAGDVTVGEGALVGIGASVVPGRTIGAWATVGAGSVVIQDVPSGEVVAGVPARRLGAD
jgi:UDP-perosamine 4-acetyltransferase